MLNIYLYTDDPSDSFDVKELVTNLEKYNYSVENRGEFLSFIKPDEIEEAELAEFLDCISIQDIESPIDKIDSKFERESEVNSKIKEKFYDAYWLQRKLYSYLLSKKGDNTSQKGLHLIVTGKLFGTFGTRRYHARVILTGVPALISTSGVVEAPARPKEYYYAKGRLLAMGRGTSELDEIYKDRFVGYDDPKITKIIYSYALQQIKAAITGEPFCENPGCSLTNSHWQEEVIKLQYTNVICDECKKTLRITF